MHFVAGFSRFVILFHTLDSTILLFLSGKPLSFAHSESGTLGRGNNVLLPRRNRADGREKNWVFSCRSSGSGVDFFSSRPRLRFSFFASYRDSAFASSLSLAAHYFSFSFPRSLQHRLSKRALARIFTARRPRLLLTVKLEDRRKPEDQSRGRQGQNARPQ